MPTEVPTADSVVGVIEGHRSQPYLATAGVQRVLQDERFEPLYKTGQHHHGLRVVARENGYPEVGCEGGSHTDN